MTYIEFAAFESLTIVVAMVNDENQLAGHVALMGILFFFVMIPDGLSVTVNCFLGIAVGEGHIKRVKNLINISVLTYLMCTICTIFVGILLGPFFQEILKTDRSMAVEFMVAYKIYIYLYTFVDHYQCLLCSILRCIGM